jgi:hypothetical protein
MAPPTVAGNAALCKCSSHAARRVAVRHRLTRQATLPLPAARCRAPTPEQIAKTVTDKRPSPVGQQPEKVEVTLKLVLPRAVAGSG